jgi:hypothetical protein
MMANNNFQSSEAFVSALLMPEEQRPVEYTVAHAAALEATRKLTRQREFEKLPYAAIKNSANEVGATKRI